MAAHIENKDIKALPVLPYSDLRAKLKSGDILFASGDYWASKAIQKVTENPWSHVGIVFRLDSIDRVLLLESVEDMGVRFAPLSKYLDDYEDGKPYKGRVVLARCKDVNSSTVEGIAGFGIDELTQPYDKDEIAKILARITLGIGKKEKDREYICSELVHECFSHAGKEFEFNSKGFISPEDVWLDEKVSLVGRIL
ncbi:Permuted papain-like amidase enzyme, YaeF/YiiX, C92 family [Nitrosomonas ureae]|uniref:Permuted papain-like amidase enzyme, YaeF/YiiX, C92 family n=1 Tax=Nitrosomonas ureae TaxID=44577 RepID=A0A285BWA4_9PROT|nr:YiiX/YebB-like N1pC/P60 family cysteine hydrolase [Nitrosomonas ureae]SNX59123.1 Permuted papain-like amidase enzyme, YaeF/YiiX, C92 family [Nitrosomonas ureae]